MKGFFQLLIALSLLLSHQSYTLPHQIFLSTPTPYKNLWSNSLTQLCGLKYYIFEYHFIIIKDKEALCLSW